MIFLALWVGTATLVQGQASVHPEHRDDGPAHFVVRELAVSTISEAWTPDYRMLISIANMGDAAMGTGVEIWLDSSPMNTSATLESDAAYRLLSRFDVPEMAPGASRLLQWHVRIPSDLKPGTYPVWVKLGAGEQVSSAGGVRGEITVTDDRTRSERARQARRSGAVPVAEEDSTALVALYNATNGPGWTTNDNWLAGAVSTWHGITVDDGRIRAIDLFGNQLNGTIPAELGRLTDLEYLQLGLNQLNGSIPAELGQLSRLDGLDLGMNELSGAIPAELGQLARLTGLSLYGNKLSGVIPPEIGQLSLLEGLGLARNQLSGPIPPELGQLDSLWILNLESNHLSGAIPVELGQMNRLEWLNLAINQLSGPIPAALGQLSALQYLTLGHNELSGEIPSALGMLSNLWNLSLSDNALTGAIPAELGQLDSLQSLHLYRNGLSGEIPGELGQMSSLQILVFHSNKLSGTIPAELALLRKLVVLDLSVNMLRGTIPADLGQLRYLKWLHLFENPLSGQMPTSLVHLQLVYFGYNSTSLCAPGGAAFQTWLQNIRTLRANGLVCSATAVEPAEDLPAAVAVSGALFPNPARDDVSFPIELSSAASVDAAVYDLLGRRVVDGSAGFLSSGHHDLKLGVGHLPAGLYVYRIEVRPDAGALAAIFNRTLTVVR